MARDKRERRKINYNVQKSGPTPTKVSAEVEQTSEKYETGSLQETEHMKNLQS
jgi:hypothetical protein